MALSSPPPQATHVVVSRAELCGGPCLSISRRGRAEICMTEAAPPPPLESTEHIEPLDGPPFTVSVCLPSYLFLSVQTQSQVTHCLLSVAAAHGFWRRQKIAPPYTHTHTHTHAHTSITAHALTTTSITLNRVYEATSSKAKLAPIETYVGSSYVG